MSAEHAGCRRAMAACWTLAVQAIAPAALADDAPPAPEFLEFLATWEAEDEDWFDVTLDELAERADQKPSAEAPVRAERDDDDEN